MKRISVSVLGGAGYIGGELVRLLLGHPNVDLKQATSTSRQGRFLHATHPNLRGRTDLKFSSSDELEPIDLLFAALPHGQLHKSVNQYRKQAGRLIDLSGDFRLRDPEVFAEWYGEKHASPDLLDEFVPGIPESYSKKLLEAYFVAMPGCMAMSSILGLKPLQEAGLLDGPIIVDAKTGSSGSGSQSSAGSHHAQRSGAMRTYKPLSHRHVAEIIQEVDPHQALGIAMSATGVEAVRGVLITAHCSAKKDATAKDLHRAYRAAYADEPFVRVVRSRTGVHRSPEPKILAGSNYCDVGFDINEDSGRLVVMSALDNLMKGGAGAAVQCMNLMFGFDQQAGLEFSGLHPA